MRSVVGVLTLCLVAALCSAADKKVGEERERQALAAITLARSPEVKTAVQCHCPAGTRGVWSDQLQKAMKEHRAVVLFAGGVEPRCCSGTLVGTIKTIPAGVDKAKPIVVYAPLDRERIQVVAELPAAATEKELTTAVNKAKELAAVKPK